LKKENGITIYHKEIRTVKNEVFKNKIVLSFKTDYEKYLNENTLVLKTKEDEYNFMIKYL